MGNAPRRACTRLSNLSQKKVKVSHKNFFKRCPESRASFFCASMYFFNKNKSHKQIQKCLTFISIESFSIYMKKLILLLSSSILALSSYGEFTETAGAADEGGHTTGTTISGSGSSSLLDSTSYEYVVFKGSSIDFDNDTNITTTNLSSKFGSGVYSFKIAAESTLNFTGKGKLILATPTAYHDNAKVGGITINATTTINVSENAGGLQTAKVCALKGTTFNLDKKNAIHNIYNDEFRSTMLTLVTSTTINATADQTFGMDIRTAVTLTANLTNGAKLIFDRLDAVVLWKDQNTATIKTNGLEDGMLLIASDFIESYDADSDTKTIITKQGNNTQTLKITGLSADAKWYKDYELDGKKYLMITAMEVAVPEPAEWAMIFGGIALGLALYRKRK